MTDPKWFELTISQAKMKFEDLVSILDKQCERYVIGDEIGGMTGYEHFQCRIVLKKGKSWDAMKTEWKAFGSVQPSHERNFLYCEKEGNYFRSWEKALREYASIKLNTWQDQCVDLYEHQNEREITVILDTEGNIGKSWLRKYLQVTHRGQYIPPMQDYKDIMRICMNKVGTGYVFDLPRADNIKQKKGMWMAIECIKDGYLFDDRYQFKEQWIKSPRILVFANEEPPYDSLSKDRWNVYTVEDHGWGKYLERWEREDYDIRS